MPEEEIKIQRYQIAVENMRYEGQLLWQISNAFLIVHTVFMAFLLQTTFSQNAKCQSYGLFLAGLIGVLLCIPWMASYQRSSHYYIFRLFQAREVEPEGWDILKNKGEEFSSGQKIRIGKSTCQINWLARVLRTKRSVPLLILTFASTYILIAIISWP